MHRWAAALIGGLLVLAVPALARNSQSGMKPGKPPPGPQGVMVQDGSNVHNVGELQMHVANWGMFGSWPRAARPYSFAPSAQWPGGSGVEYLFTAGLWVGALRGGVPRVSTASYEFEFRPTQDSRDIIYRTGEGASGGTRLPSRAADDDSDGMIDEDWLNGYDDDGDGLIDEDFSAVSKQMFSCQYTDNETTSLQIYPEHNPLNVHIRQESYQWEEDRFDDFVGVNYWITNIGQNVLEDVYIGFFADGDAGSRTAENYWEDDATGFVSLPVVCTDVGPVSMDIAFIYDADGDEGTTSGRFGIMFLGHTTDPLGEFAPERVSISTYAHFSGTASFEDGGDPTNDFERYEVLSSHDILRDSDEPRDYRMLMAGGPFRELPPGSTLVFQTAFVIGSGLGGMIQNASAAQLTFDGAWFDLDGDPRTGVDGRETPVYGPVSGVVIDSCRAELSNPISWNQKDPLYINDDCVAEDLARVSCGYLEGDSLKFRTGVNGQEFQIHWIIGTAPPPPRMRVDNHARDGVVVYWDNFSETVPDVKTLEDDFEGYRVWRADMWNRPIGTSEANGPQQELWRMLFQADVINNFGEDTGLDPYRYEPLTHILSSRRKRDMINYTKEYFLEYKGSFPPCPQGVTAAVCDTIQRIALAELGDIRGRYYYRYVDPRVQRGRPYFYSVTALDHAFDDDGSFLEGRAGDPSSNFVFVEPATVAQPAHAYDTEDVYVVPNPATPESMQAWALQPNNDDPTGIKVEFQNLPADRGTIRIYTLAGDLVQELRFNGSGGIGTKEWDLVSRNGQDVTSGVYLYAIDTDSNQFKRKVGKFIIIR